LNTVNNLVTNESAPYQIEMINIQAPEQGAFKMIPDFPYNASTFTVTLSGHYHDFGLFLAEVENSHPFVRVKSFELEPTSAATEDLAINLDVVALIQPPQKP
jgi:Tfp pilus assembly protein PilO